MESNNGLRTFKEKPDPSKDVVMEELTCIDPGDVSNDQEKSNTFTHHSFFRNTFSRNTLDRMKEQAKNVTASKAITAIIIFCVIVSFLVPIIIYYASEINPLPKSDNVLRDTNISVVSLYRYTYIHIYISNNLYMYI